MDTSRLPGSTHSGARWDKRNRLESARCARVVFLVCVFLCSVTVLAVAPCRGVLSAVYCHRPSLLCSAFEVRNVVSVRVRSNLCVRHRPSRRVRPRAAAWRAARISRRGGAGGDHATPVSITRVHREFLKRISPCEKTHRGNGIRSTASKVLLLHVACLIFTH